MFLIIFLSFATILLSLILHWINQMRIRPKNFPPGPIGLPLLGYAPFIRFPLCEGLMKISKTYGSVFSIFIGTYRTVVISDADLVREALKDDRFIGRPEFKITISRGLGKSRGIVAGAGDEWKAQRRFAIRTLHDFGYGKPLMENLIENEIVELVEELKKDLNVPINFPRNKISVATLNCLWQIIGGERFAKEDPKLKELIRNYDEGIRISLFLPLLFFDWFTEYFPNLSRYNKAIQIITTTFKNFEKYIKSHKEKLVIGNPKDIIDAYLEEIEKTTDPKSSFYGEEGMKSLLVFIADLFGTGIESTATTIEWIILYLISYPEIQDLLYNEIIDVIGTERRPQLADRRRMPYAESVIMETLRLSTFLPVSGRTTTEDVEFHGFFIPKDTICLINHWLVHFDPKIWADPESFKPERFISPEGRFEMNEYTIPFSIGKRSCPGEALSRDELFLFITSLIQTFEFKTDPSGPKPSLIGQTGLLYKPKMYKVLISTRNK